MKFLIVAGARPNFMKIAPIIRAFQAEQQRIPDLSVFLVHTGQHYDRIMSDSFFEDLGIPEPDVNLQVGSGSHAQQTAQIMAAFEPVCLEHRPDWVIVVGDVNSTMACAITAKKLGIQVAHVEAGLRSGDMSMPEEINRRCTDAITDLLFTTDHIAGENLRREGISEANIRFVGNTMIDTLVSHIDAALARPLPKGLPEGGYAVLTLHRPRNVDFAENLRGILEAMMDIAQRLPIIFPAHPRTVGRLREFGLLENLEDEASNIRLIEPQSYLSFLGLIGRARLVLTDSGGIQEETTFLDVPCVTMRSNTERPITCELGTNILAGTDPAAIRQAAVKMLDSPKRPRSIPEKWDGRTGERIVLELLKAEGAAAGVAAEKQRIIPLLDLRAQHRAIRDEVLAEVTRVIDSQKFVLGDDVEKLEQAIAKYSSTRFAIGCASGTDALFLALLALNIGQGNEVLTTPYTFFATAGAISRSGARPVFVDVEESTCNMDMGQVEGILDRHPKVRAVIPVHLFGGCADMGPLCRLTAERGIAVIEDAAQSIGSEYKGRRAGSIGQIGCLSFFPSKNLGGYGDGGMLTTNDPELAELLTALRVHGSRRKYYHEWIGINSRLDALQAAVLRVKLKYLDSWSEGRRRNADLYRKFLGELEAPVIAPCAAPYQTKHVYNQFVIRAKRRDELKDYLKEHGIETEIYYPLPLHLQACFAHLGYKPGDFPASERLARESLALPIYSELGTNEIESVCRAIGSFYA